MWGGGQPQWSGGPGQPPPSQTWSLDPNHYTQIPHQNVDWATLAQQWIQMKGPDILQPHQHVQQHQPPHPQVLHFPLTSFPVSADPHHLDVIGEAPMDLDESGGQNDSVAAPLYTRSASNLVSSETTTYTRSASNVASSEITTPGGNLGKVSHVPGSPQPWLRHPFPNQVPKVQPHGESRFTPDSSLQLSGNYNSNHGGWAQNHGGSSYEYERGKHHNAKSSGRKHSLQEEEHYEEDLEAANRRALPSWIREGLEKVEREKRKAEERESLIAAREEERRLRRIRDHQTDLALSPQEDPDHPVQQLAVENEDDDDAQPLTIKLKGFLRQPSPKPEPPQPTLSEIFASLTKDEQMEQVMLSVRRKLTQILLEVTNGEMRAVAQEALERARAKSKGLGGYGSDSDDQDSPDEDDEPVEVDSDAELIAEIDRKKRNFEMKILLDEEEDSENRTQNNEDLPEQKKRSRSKSIDAKTTNGKTLDPLPPKQPLGSFEKGHGEESKKVDEKRSERSRRKSRSRSTERRSSTASSRSSPRKDRKLRRSRSRSRSKKRDRRDRKSKSPNSRRREKRRSRSRSKSKKKSGHPKSRSRSSSRSRTHRSDKSKKSDTRRKRHRSASSSSTSSSSLSKSSRTHSRRTHH